MKRDHDLKIRIVVVDLFPTPSDSGGSHGIHGRTQVQVT